MDDEASGTPVPEGPEIPITGEGERRASTRRRILARIVLAVAAAALLVVGVVAVRALGGGDVDPGTALRRAEALLGDAESYRLTVTSEDQSGLGARVGPGVHTTIRVVDDIEVSGDNWRSRSDGGDWQDESIVVDGTFYSRWGDSYTPIDGEQWAASPLPDPDERDWADAPSETLQWFTTDIESIADDEMLAEDDQVVDEMVVALLGALYLAGLGDPGLGSAAGPSRRRPIPVRLPVPLERSRTPRSSRSPTAV